MKSLFPFCSFFFFLQSVFAQGAWFAPASEWTLHVSFGAGVQGIQTLRYAKDTSIQNVVYQQIKVSALRQNTGLEEVRFRYIRQDGDKIFALASNGVEFLMYDFSLKVGDKVLLPLYDFNAPGFGYEITELGETDINGQTFRTQKVKWLNESGYGISAQKGYFIENLGNVMGLHVIAGVDCFSDANFFLDESYVYGVGVPKLSFCYFNAEWGHYDGLAAGFCTVLDAPAPVLSRLQLYPNPSTGHVQISQVPEGLPYHVQVYDLNGRLLQEEQLYGSGLVQAPCKGTLLFCIQQDNAIVRRLVQID